MFARSHLGEGGMPECVPAEILPHPSHYNLHSRVTVPKGAAPQASLLLPPIPTSQQIHTLCKGLQAKERWNEIWEINVAAITTLLLNLSCSFQMAEGWFWGKTWLIAGSWRVWTGPHSYEEYLYIMWWILLLVLYRTSFQSCAALYRAFWIWPVMCIWGIALLQGKG